MPAEFTIDSQRGVVITRASGVFTQADFLDHMARLQADPHFNPDFNQIIDCCAITTMDLTPEQIAALAERTAFSAKSRRALVVTSDLHYGLSRMFATYREIKGGEELRVFRDLPATQAWLGIAPEANGQGAGKPDSKTRKK